jgi:hypothetical protein
VDIAFSFDTECIRVSLASTPLLYPHTMGARLLRFSSTPPRNKDGEIGFSILVIYAARARPILRHMSG